MKFTGTINDPCQLAWQGVQKLDCAAVLAQVTDFEEKTNDFPACLRRKSLFDNCAIRQNGV